MMTAKNTSDSSSSLAHKFTAIGIDPLQVLIDAGLDPETENIKLTMQINIAPYVQKSVPPLPHELEKQQQKLIADKRAAVNTVNEWLKKMVLNQPAVVLQATLIWLGHYHAKQKETDSQESSDWLLFYSINGELHLNTSDATISLKNTQKRLLDCLNEHPEKTIKALQFASRFHELSFSCMELYNSPERLESFFHKYLPSWNEITNQNENFKLTVQTANDIYITKINNNKSQALSILIKALEYNSCASTYELKTLNTLLESWQKIIGMDIKFLSNYNKIHTLNIAAREACGIDGLKGKIQIVEGIDIATNFEYSVLSKRNQIYRKIDLLYTSRTAPLEVNNKPQVYTLTSDETKALNSICERKKLSKAEATNSCIEFAYKASKKPKKQLEESVAPLFKRTDCNRTSIRISLEAIQQLNDLTGELNGLKATSGRVISKSAAVGWAIKLYAAYIAQQQRSPAKDDFSPELLIRKRDPNQDIQNDDGLTHLVKQKKEAKHKPAHTESIEPAEENSRQAETGSSATTQEPAQDHEQEHLLNTPRQGDRTNTFSVIVRKRKYFTR